MKYANAVDLNAAYKKAAERLGKMHPGAFSVEELGFILHHQAAATGGHTFQFHEQVQGKSVQKSQDEKEKLCKIVARMVELSERTIGI